MKLSSVFKLASLLAAFSLTGCSYSDAPELNLVTGTLTKAGKPVVNAQVEFYPKTKGAASYGVTDDQGNFALRYSTGKPGAAVDKHLVSVIGGHVSGEKGAVADVSSSLAGEEAAEGTLAPLGGPVKSRRGQSSGAPKSIEGLAAEVVADGPNHIELSI